MKKLELFIPGWLENRQFANPKAGMLMLVFAFSVRAHAHAFFGGLSDQVFRSKQGREPFRRPALSHSFRKP